jgi:hypothetical protein
MMTPTQTGSASIYDDQSSSQTPAPFTPARATGYGV